MDDFLEDDDPFAPNGRLTQSNTRGNANQEVTGFAYDPLLDDKFNYDGLPPGPGAAPATDLMSLDELDAEDDVLDDRATPGMVQTTYGAHSWGIDTSRGYRPESMMTADRNMNSMGSDDIVPVNNPPSNPQAGLMPSNEDLDQDTIYDRQSYEVGKVFGSGIFDMEEGTTWRPSYGSFADQYALPDYMGREDEMNVQGSMMWDVTRGAWRVVQPTASGVALSRIVPGSPAGAPGRYSPFVSQPMETGPAPKNIEKFGHEVATTIVRGAATLPVEHRNTFVTNSIEALGPGLSRKAAKIAARLVAMGHPKEVALHDALAHLVMHAAAGDLRVSVERAKRGTRAAEKLPSISRLTTRTGPAVGGHIKQLRAQLLAPAEGNATVAQGELGSYYASSAKGRVGYLQGLAGEEAPAPTAAATATAAAKDLMTPRNLLIGAAVLGGAFYAYQTGMLKKIGMGALSAGKSGKSRRSAR